MCVCMTVDSPIRGDDVRFVQRKRSSFFFVIRKLSSTSISFTERFNTILFFFRRNLFGNR